MKSIPVIDLFAGPGGLCEGFHAFGSSSIDFDIALSIEKEKAPHRTLTLRSFYRQLKKSYDKVPEAYYDYLRGDIESVDELFSRHEVEAKAAQRIAMRATLGEEPFGNIHSRIAEGLNGAKHWVLIGGPPCQAYSLIGRARMGGSEDFKEDHRHTLYREYLKVVAAFQPTVFVMENVKGILSSNHKDNLIFNRIRQDLGDPWNALEEKDRGEIPVEPNVKHKYRLYSFVENALFEDELKPEDFIIESEKYGLPQRRHRVIILGVRADYDIKVNVIEPAGEKFDVESIIGNMPPLRSKLSRGDKGGALWCDSIKQGWEDGYFSEVVDKRLKNRIEMALWALDGELTPGDRFVAGNFAPSELADWLYKENRLGGVCQHEARGHMQSDFWRYLYASSYADEFGVSPKLTDFPSKLYPDHKSAYKIDGKTPIFNDRFRVQVAGEPSTTITAHICKDGHYFIHYDPVQCRSLTVREAARLQTFPDDYFFEGNRTEQYHQVGNAVPPFLAYQLADVVAEVLEDCISIDEVRGEKVANY